MARKACHNADPPCISSTVAPPQHGTQGPATTNLPQCQHSVQDPTTMLQRQHIAQDPATMPFPTWYAKHWSSGGDGGSGGQWDGSGGDGSNGEALLLPQTVHILSVQ